MIAAVLLSAALLAICTAVQYLALRPVSDVLAKRGWTVGGALALCIATVTLAHVIEAAIYAAAFLWASEGLDIGRLTAPQGKAPDPDWMDYFYFSLVNYTTLGRGDLAPTGHLRFITAMEAFHGFLMITASGSFTVQIMAGEAPLSRGLITRSRSREAGQG